LFRATADSTIGEVPSRREVGDLEKDSHNDIMRVLPHNLFDVFSGWRVTWSEDAPKIEYLREIVHLVQCGNNLNATLRCV
jgi:hypothetical protein